MSCEIHDMMFSSTGPKCTCATPRPTQEKEEKMHPLTERMYTELKREHTKGEVDSIIREYLSEKARKIVDVSWSKGANTLQNGIDEILDITPKQKSLEEKLRNGVKHHVAAGDDFKILADIARTHFKECGV